MQVAISIRSCLATNSLRTTIFHLEAMYDSVGGLQRCVVIIDSSLIQCIRSGKLKGKCHIQKFAAICELLTFASNVVCSD